jgi:FtsP/CotA-like multicopper oxidase with cupredoxin domain
MCSSSAVQGHGGWRHPIHIHLIDFRTVRRTGGDKDQYVDWDILRQVRAGGNG